MSLWIESHTGLKGHRKVRELASRLGTHRTIVLGMLHAILHNVLPQQEDGDLGRWSDAVIAECWDLEPLRAHMRFQEGPEAFVKMLTEVGLLDPNRVVHDWLDYVGKLLRKRYSGKDRARLEAIWQKHGRVYGAEDAPPQRPIQSPRRATPPPVKARSVQDHPATPAATALTLLLAQLMRANDAQAKIPPFLSGWEAEAQRLLTLDQRPAAEAERVLQWCQADPFWRANIHSMATFREKYPKLRLQMERGGAQKKAAPPLSEAERQAYEGR